MIRRFLLGALLAGSIPFGVPAAHACPPQDANINDCTPGINVVLVEGSGNIDGGLPCTGCAITFDFTAVNVGTDDPGVYTGCHFAGTPDHTDDNLSGAGSGTLSGCPASGTVTYSRTGALVQVSGTVNTASGPHNIGASALLFIPTSAQPVTSFIVVGAVLLD